MPIINIDGKKFNVTERDYELYNRYENGKSKTVKRLILGAMHPKLKLAIERAKKVTVAPQVEPEKKTGQKESFTETRATFKDVPAKTK